MNLSVYVVEDDISACDRFKTISEYVNEINFESFTDNANEAYNYIIEFNPDVIILDLELNIGNGPELLTKINKLPANKRPYVIITTNNSNPITIEYLHQNNSGFIFYKYKPNYSECEVLNFIKMFKTSIYNYRNCIQNDDHIVNENIETLILSDIDKELIRIGISEKITGYKYLKSAIFYVMKNKYDNKLLKELASLYHCKSQSIEHNMRYAINSAWSKYKSINDLKKVYTGHISNDMDAPSAGVFITHYAETLKNKHASNLEKLKS